MRKILSILLVLITFSGCIDPEEDVTVELEFEETQCANPWDAIPGVEDYLLTVREYLENNGVIVYAISVEGSNIGAGPTCAACICPSGRKVHIRVPESAADAAISIGFKITE